MPALMVVGCTSNAGKSLLVTALCGWLAQQGYRVTPFKGQNMALNAYVTSDGGEMGYAQAVQAWAADIVPTTAMNPILLKPQGDMTSQVIIQGRAVGVTQAQDYYQNYFDLGWQAITQSLTELQKEYDYIVCEGAGSPAEINLKHRDLTNMRVAKYLQAKTILVGDINPGGVFAHIIGTLALLDPEERALIKGLIINKFRGQKSILDPGLSWLETNTKIPVLGVIPWLEQQLPAEDSLSLFARKKSNTELNIAIIQLPKISNFTDFDPLLLEPTVQVNYIQAGQNLGTPDVVIIPGSKTTIADLNWLHTTGLAEQIISYHQKGGWIFGICGGMQMLGVEVHDPQGLESNLTKMQGLNLLPTKTIITPNKITQQRQSISVYPVPNVRVNGYEIHQGFTQVTAETKPLFLDPHLGYVDGTGRVWGTYLHGIFENGTWRKTWLNQLRSRRGLAPLTTDVPDFSQQRRQMLQNLTQTVAAFIPWGQFLKDS
ncbi:cobyric acid synthase [Gloeomargarita lithophora Alchichica-D10]|uniref:Cobyric acid synthase n=1 Tax=Gloeomargarita lithophora Alchichica-D10 TaxID=1188229 RepID=A0A1J0ABM4_9CYAN|nr:cobyric acid synthase CobQ [Gloeomargarita lithophora]APB33332.1 cobyric acid synthase [Gloeomargarita lithophora Alchichica-D10]